MKLWPFRRKGLIPSEPRGLNTVETAPTALRLGDRSIPYDQLYRESPSVRAVVDFLSLNVGQVPLRAFVRGGGLARKPLGERDDLVTLLREPNPRTSPFELKRDLVSDLALFGNAYWLMVRGRPGDPPGALVRLPAGKVSIVRSDTTLVQKYRVQFGSGSRDFPAADVAHFAAYSRDGLLGTSPLESLRGVLGEDTAALEHREGFWRNSAKQSGVIERALDAPDWSAEARKRFREDWRAATTGERSGETAILEDGMTWKPSAFSPRDAEYVAARKLTLAFVASVYSVPLQLLGGTDRNVDAAMRGLLQNTLAPWLTWIEETVNRTVVPAVAGEQSVRGRIFTEFVLEEKARGSFKQHSEMLERAVGGPWLSVNEARALVNLPPVDGGDRPYVPAGSTPTPTPTPLAE